LTVSVPSSAPVASWYTHTAGRAPNSVVSAFTAHGAPFMVYVQNTVVGATQTVLNPFAQHVAPVSLSAVQLPALVHPA